MSMGREIHHRIESERVRHHIDRVSEKKGIMSDGDKVDMLTSLLASLVVDGYMTEGQFLPYWEAMEEDRI